MTALIPVNISFLEWAAELRNSYPTQDIPYFVSSENDWRSFLPMLQSNRCFEDKFLPNAVNFQNWRDWASQFLLSVGS